MKPRYLLLATAVLGAGPAVAQTVTVSQCSSVAASNVAKSTDKVKLAADIACDDRALPIATAQIAAHRKARADRLAQLTPAPTPTPPPAPVPVPTGLNGVAPVASGLDVASLLAPSWGTGAIPEHDVDVGAFRLICTPSHNAYNDPIVYPGQPGKSHLHTFFGNTLTDANSTYASLRTTGDSTCNNALNRSGYWVASMMHPSGKVVMPDFFAVYYKRIPASDPRCTLIAKACLPLPRGLRMVFGYNMTNPTNNDPAVGRWWNCPDGNSGHFATIAEAAKGCPVGHQIEFVINSRDCWNGKDVDSPDHRSHLAWREFDGSGKYPYPGRCPDTHPYLIPQITEEGFYTIDATAADWKLSSDIAMGMAGGSTLHADWFGAWEDSILARWTNNCIDKLLSCSGGDLGDGFQIKTTNGYNYKQQLTLVDPPLKP